MELAIVEKIEKELLTCEICEERAFQNQTDFHILPCQHTICEECVKGMVERRRNLEPLQCPWCRQEFSVPESGKLPTFRYATNLSAELKNTKSLHKEKEKKSMHKQEKGKTISEIAPLKIFSFEKSLYYEVHCAGRDGKFYGKPSRYCKGLSFINILHEAKLIRFGNMQSDYAGMVFIGEELYAFNFTQGYIEVYRNEVLARSWHIEGSYWFGRLTWYSFTFGDLSRNAKLNACSANEICLTYTNKDETKIWVFSQQGDPLQLNDGVRDDVRELLANGKQYQFQNSIWILNSNDHHLWEIPTEEIDHKITFKKPIKHSKTGEFSSCCQINEGKILITTGSLVKLLDLEAIKGQRNEGKRLSNRRQRGRNSQEEAKPTVHNLLTSVYRESQRLHVSEDGYVALQGEGHLTTYKLVHPEQQLTAQSVALSDIQLPGPEYQSYGEIVSTTYAMLSQCATTTKNRLLSLLYLLFYIFMFIVLCACLAAYWHRGVLRRNLPRVYGGILQVLAGIYE